MRKFSEELISVKDETIFDLDVLSKNQENYIRELKIHLSKIHAITKEAVKEVVDEAFENSDSSSFEVVANENCKNSEATASPVSSLHLDSSPLSSTRTIAAQIASQLLTEMNKNSLDSYLTASSESIESSKVIPRNNCEDSPKSPAVL